MVTATDRRVFNRFTARFPVRYKHSYSDFGTDVFLRDVSAQGAKIVTRQKITPLDQVDLLVELPDGHEPMDLSGNVVWTQTVNPTSRIAGIKFNKADFMDIQRIFKFCQ